MFRPEQTIYPRLDDVGVVITGETIHRTGKVLECFSTNKAFSAQGASLRLQEVDESVSIAVDELFVTEAEVCYRAAKRNAYALVHAAGAYRQELIDGRKLPVWRKAKHARLARELSALDTLSASAYVNAKLDCRMAELLKIALEDSRIIRNESAS